VPTTEAACSFFGALVKTAIANASDPDFICASWPIDMIDISRHGISEQQYASLDELKVP
jgi:hypothetical protein